MTHDDMHAIFESEPEYLDRLGLMAADERTALLSLINADTGDG
jgi:hypothetical protein